ncbi:MAG: phosphate/phosphite/phosphonate ABC transporter substrate-binding protein, partial [Anaerolineae bacterium]
MHSHRGGGILRAIDMGTTSKARGAGSIPVAVVPSGAAVSREGHGLRRLPLVGALFIVVSVGAVACSSPEYPVVHLESGTGSEIVAAERAPGRLPLRVVAASVLSPKATFDVYRPILDVLAEALDRPVTLLQRPTYAETNELLRTGQADIGFVCGGAFVEGERAGYMELLALPQVAGRLTYRAFVIVPAASAARSLDDLQGMRFAFSDPLSNSGRLYVEYVLRTRGTTPESFFSETVFTYGHDNSIRAVVDGLVDGATVDSLVYLAMTHRDPDLAGDLRVIKRSPEFGIPPVVVHPDLDPGLKQAVTRALLAMHSTQEGRSALAPLGVERFREPDVTAYDEIREMAAVDRAMEDAEIVV